MNTRNLKDVLLRITTALPAQNTTTTSEAVFLGVGMFDAVAVRISVPATPSLADAETITLRLEHSDDGSSYSNVEQFAALVATGAGGEGAAALQRDYPLFSGVKKYLRISQSASASAGDNTTVSSSLELLF